MIQRSVRSMAVLTGGFGLSLILGALVLQGQAVTESHAAALPQIPAPLRKAIIQELLPRVQTVSQSFVISHYTHRSDVKIPLTGLVDPVDPLFSQYVQRSIKSFQRGSKDDDVAGSGMYFAIDPVISRQYGGKNWVLIQGKVKPGARFLDLTQGEPFFSHELREQIQSFGCDSWAIQDVFQYDEIPACQALRLEISNAPELNVHGLYYQFASSELPGCGEDGAFLVWRSALFSEAEAFTSGVAQPESADPQLQRKQELQALFDWAVEPGLYAGNMDPYPELEGALPRAQIRQWAKRNLKGCK